MNIRTRNFARNTRLRLTAAAAVVAAAGAATPAFAQSSQDRDQRDQRQQQRDDQQRRDRNMDQRDRSMNQSWQDKRTERFARYYDAYYDGYNDAYTDDKFGQSKSFEKTGVAAMGYDHGYYDGWYDQSMNYEADPYYYVVLINDQDRNKATDQKRARDKDRRQGDRARAMTDNTTNQDRMAQRRAARDYADQTRIRGEITDWSRKSMDAREGRTLLNVQFKDRDDAIVDLGRDANLSRLDLTEGDTVTLVGEKRKIDGRTVLIADKICAHDSTYKMSDGQWREAGNLDAYGDSWNNDRRSTRDSARAMDDGRGYGYYEEGYDRDQYRDDRNTRRGADSTARRDVDPFYEAGPYRDENNLRGYHHRDYRDDYRATHDERYRERAGEARRDTVRISGAVNDWERIDHDGKSLVRIEFEDGRTRVFDFGGDTRLDELDISTGDSVSIRGDSWMRDGRRVVHVERLSVEGERRRLTSRQ